MIRGKFKIIILLFIVNLFLTGCGGWEDVQNNYADLLNKGVRCTYIPNGETTLGIDTLVLSADYDGAYVQINGGSKQTLISTSGTNNWISFEGRNIQFTDDAIQGYLQKYSTDNRCPNNIYINSDSQSGVDNFRLETCAGMLGGFCNAYKWNTSSDKDTSSCTTKKGCSQACATDCMTINKEVDNLGEAGVPNEEGKSSVNLEFGYYKTSSGDLKKYFAVVADKAAISTEDEGFIVNRNLESYEIVKESIDKIWPSGGGFIEKGRLKITASVFNDHTVYYISDSSLTDVPGEFDKTDELDPGRIETPEANVDLPEISNCNMLLGYPSDEGSPAYYLVKAFDVIKYVAIVLLIVLSLMDFFSAIASQDKDIIKKSANKMLRRFILCIIIFLLPYIIGMLLKYIANRQADICGIK